MLTTDTARELIADFQEKWVPPLTPREIALDLLGGKVAAVYGPRRAGKTYLLYQAAEAAAGSGLDRRNILYLNFEDERILPLDAVDLGTVVELFDAGRPDYDSPALLLLDEVVHLLRF